MKKCEQSVNDHEAYLAKYKECVEWLSHAQARYQACQDATASVSQQELAARSAQLNTLASDKPTATLLLNATVERGETCCVTTAVEGREVVRSQLEELQVSLESLYDGVSSLERDLQVKLSRSVINMGLK